MRLSPRAGPRAGGDTACQTTPDNKSIRQDLAGVKAIGGGGGHSGMGVTWGKDGWEWRGGGREEGGRGNRKGYRPLLIRELLYS